MASCMDARRCLLQGGTAGGRPSVFIRGADGNVLLIPLLRDAGVTVPELASVKYMYNAFSSNKHMNEQE